MAVLVELQRVLRGVCQRVERRRPHVLRSEVLVLVLIERHVVEGRVWLMHTGGNHVASVRSGLGHNCTSRPRRRRLNGGGLTMLTAQKRRGAEVM
jgi:hypothetical protein